MRTRLMGILNLTPDSFSDGGRYADAGAMLEAARAMLAAGACVVDVGAESTRPGAVPLSAEEEWARLAPFAGEVMPALLELGAEISIDTRHAATAARMLERGAGWVNDVGGLKDSAMVDTLLGYDCKVVVMHSLTVPADPDVTLPERADVLGALYAFFTERAQALAQAGIARGRLVFDPGLGFGKTAEQSLCIVRNIEIIRGWGLPLLIGHSRKSFLKLLAPEPQQRDNATLALSARLMLAGVEFLRVHDVAAHGVLARTLSLRAP